MTIEERLARLEKQNRCLRMVLSVGVLAMFGAIGFGFTRSAKIPEVIEAREFRVVGEKGGALVTLKSVRPTSHSPDDSPQAGSVVVATDRYDAIELRGQVFGSGPDAREFDGGEITIRSGRHRENVRLSAGGDEGHLYLKADSGRKAILASASKDLELMQFGPYGREVFQLTSMGGNTSLRFEDEKGNAGLELSYMRGISSGSINLFSPKGVTVARISSIEGVSASLELVNPETLESIGLRSP